MALPLVLNYTGADGTNLNTIGFTHNNGAFAINTNAAYSNSASTETGTHDNTNTYNNDQYAQGTVSPLASNKYIGVAVRCAASAATWYGYYTDLTSDGTLYKMVAGVWTSLGAGAAAAAGSLLYAEAVGTAILAKKGGVNQFGGAVTDSSIASGSAGLAGYDNGTGSRIDSTTFDNIGGGGGGGLPYFMQIDLLAAYLQVLKGNFQ